MMEQSRVSEHPHQQRQSAAEAFVQSLEQLEAVLQPEAAKASDPSPAAPSAASPRPEANDLASAFEAAAADIEQYMNAHQP